MRCIPLLDFLNNRYMELNQQTAEADALLDSLNRLYKFHSNPISYVYNSLIYYKQLNESVTYTDDVFKLKKKRIFSILSSNQSNACVHFTPQFQTYLDSIQQDISQMGYSNPPDISHLTDMNYYYNLIRRLINRMLDKELASNEFKVFRSEFQNPSCHLLYTSLCELISLELFSSDPAAYSRSICSRIVDMFFTSRFGNGQFRIDKDHFVYWTNAAGTLIANLPDSYWQPIYETLAEVMKTDELLNSTSSGQFVLFDQLDLYLADEKGCFNRLTLITTIMHSVWTHSSANHFQYFAKFLKERKQDLVKTENQFLFICKLIGPFLSKIHMENTNLLIDFTQELYEMIYLVDQTHAELFHIETICNFFYHLKYRHIGESIKDKIHSLMPNFRPELKKQFKFITSEINQQLQMQQLQQNQLLNFK
jgi:mediator of RNA polymerase II transcription subunit 23